MESAFDSPVNRLIFSPRRNSFNKINFKKDRRCFCALSILFYLIKVHINLLA